MGREKMKWTLSTVMVYVKGFFAYVFNNKLGFGDRYYFYNTIIAGVLALIAFFGLGSANLTAETRLLIIVLFIGSQPIIGKLTVPESRRSRVMDAPIFTITRTTIAVLSFIGIGMLAIKILYAFGLVGNPTMCREFFVVWGGIGCLLIAISSFEHVFFKFVCHFAEEIVEVIEELEQE